MREAFLGLLLWAGLVTPVVGGTHQVPQDESIASVVIPDKWQTQDFEDRVQTASPDGALRLMILQPEGTKVADAMGEVMRHIRNTGGIVVRDDSPKPEPGQLNGMEVRNISWQGKDAKGDVGITFSVVSVADKKPLLVAWRGSPAAQRKYRGELDRILKSLKRL